MNATNNKKRLLLPMGIQDFVKIREGGYVYVDKTERIHELVTGSEAACFLSRPRRFGKSLLCSTLKALFEGRRELFGEIAGRPALAIDSLEWDWKKRPVIHIDLNPGEYADGIDGLRSTLMRQLKREAKAHGVTIDETDCVNYFASLIEEVSMKSGERVAVIIDEYDKPMLSTIDDIDLCRKMRDVLKGFYGVLKSSDPHLHFLILTGVTKFSHVSIFSDLNHLTDLTFNPRYADICGIAEAELLQNFEPEIAAVVEERGRKRKEYLDNLRRYYDGYRFTKKPLKLYNPYGLLRHFSEVGDFNSYWFETGTPTFLVKLISEQKINIANLSKMQVTNEEFRRYDVEDMKAIPVLYQTGYLTITDYDEENDEFTLDYPNIEVRSSFSQSLLDRYLQPQYMERGALVSEVPKKLIAGDITEVINVIRRYLASIPNDIIEDREKYFQTAIHLIFTMFKLNCQSEVRIAAGRIDTLVVTKDFVYCFEFKLDKTADEALAQIDTKEYLLPWEDSGKKLFKVGVNFDSEKRNVGEWKYTVVEGK